MSYDVTDIYGFNSDPHGVEQLDDAELAARERLLRTDLASMQRTFARFEDFCEHADWDALGAHTIDGIYCNAAGLDYSIEQDGRELQAVSAERAYRAEAYANAGSDEPDEGAWWMRPD